MQRSLWLLPLPPSHNNRLRRPAAQPAPVVAPAYTAAQIDQWVAPIALYPDALLSQILMASTYPANIIQAAQWSKDNPKLQGDVAIQAVANQPWDPSVKSLVAFPQLMSLMGEKSTLDAEPGRRFSRAAKRCDGFRATSAFAGAANRCIAINTAANGHHRDKTGPRPKTATRPDNKHRHDVIPDGH